MIYVISDIHGQDDKFFRLLKEINFCDEDQLIIVGDIADRGPGSAKIFKYIMDKNNITTLLGNHEIFMIDYYEKFGATFNDSHPWMEYGGLETFYEIMSDKNSKILLENIINYLRTLPTIKSLKINEKTFVFCHAALDVEEGRISNFQDKQHLLWGDISKIRPIALKDNTFVVTGHLRCADFNPDKANNIFFEESWILMDGGCGFGGQLNCLRLDDMKTFEVK